MAGELERLTAGRPAELVATARTLVEIIDGSEHELESAVKWGALTYALEGDFHHWVCSVGVTKARATLTFHYGGILDDPGGRLIAGSSKLLRKLEYATEVDVGRDEVLGFLDQAVAAYPRFKEHWSELM